MDPTPEAASIPIGLAVLLIATAGVGMVLLLAGQRVLLAMLGLIGGVVGAAAGWIAFSILLPEAPAWVGAVAVGGVGAVMLALCARLVIAVVLAAVLGAAGWLSVTSADRHGWLELSGSTTNISAPSPTPSAPVPAEDASQTVAFGLDARDQIEARLLRFADPFRMPQLQHRLSTAGGFVAGAVGTVGQQWTKTPRALRTLTVASAGMCAFLGLCLGLVAPRFAAAGITAALGAALVVLCAVVTVQQFTGDLDRLPGAPSLWLGGWGLLTLAGAVLQSVRTPDRNAPQPAKA